MKLDMDEFSSIKETATENMVQNENIKPKIEM